MGHLDGRRKGLRRRSGSLSSVVERVCFARAGSVYSIHPVAPLTFVSQAGSLVTRRVLVADATFKRPKDFWTPEEHPVHHQNGHQNQLLFPHRRSTTAGSLHRPNWPPPTADTRVGLRERSGQNIHKIKEIIKLRHVSTSTRPSATALPGS
jgi:hypothetical protein